MVSLQSTSVTHHILCYSWTQCDYQKSFTTSVSKTVDHCVGIIRHAWIILGKRGGGGEGGCSNPINSASYFNVEALAVPRQGLCYL